MVADGPVGAIGVCHDVAPALAKQVGEEQGIKIGRTSFRLRNTSNTPPAWAQAAVENHVESPQAFVSPEGEVGRLRPIRMMAGCLQCHGDAQQIDPAVQAQLTELYPDDQATGFAEGDVRGYFWAQVPAAR